MSNLSSPEPEMEAPQLVYAFAPIHKRAFGVAIGLAAGLLIFGLTAIHLLRQPYPEFSLGLLRQYFAGYSVSWPGAIVGFAWGFLTGFVAGWFFAFCRNLTIGISIFFIRVRSELSQTRDFLDHI